METTRTKNRGSKTGRSILESFAFSQSFRLGSFQIHYYGVILAGAILIGYLVTLARAAKFGISKKQIEDVGFWLIIWSIIGARIYYVLFYYSEFRGHPAEIFKIWHGGQAIYGALIFGALTLWYFSRKTKISFFTWTDLVAFALPLAQAFGRLGNFFNYEAFGKPTNLPWKIFIPEQYRPAGYESNQYFHPTFAYELLWNVFVFIVLLGIERFLKKHPQSKFKFNGIYTGIYLFAYSFGRFFIEGIRLDSAYFGPFRGDQLTALFIMLGALGIMLYRYAQTDH